jgi:hypothetical protein
MFILHLKLHLQSYNKCWKCPPCLAMQASTLFLMLLATLCTVTLHVWYSMFCFSSSSEYGLLSYTFSLNYPTKYKTKIEDSVQQ